MLALFLAGCQKGVTEKDFEGIWNGTVSMSEAEMKKSIEKAPGATVQQVKDFLATIKLKLDLKADKTYTLKQGLGAPTEGVEGTWALKDMKVTLTPTKGAGMTKEEAIKLNPNAKSQFEPIGLSSDKEIKTLSGIAPSGPGMPGPTLTFVKEAPAKTDAPKK